ncbi:expressed unknown protein [Seminavis robusta]|uniref:Uncharacterized protein n=1 Tax=Seminavis robusta TaxID=568900 RepID=A0A9N8DN48_9STRA|nr:expressed unknown protein [Seminavis robusta]|eukprot:Sro170_g075430.1 n/a (954) ;mRNA; r:50471-53332
MSILLVVVVVLLVTTTSVSGAVCLAPRVDLTNNDRAAYHSSANNGWKGVVQISGNIVARNRNGIFHLNGDTDTAMQQQVGDTFGYDMELVALADQGRVVAVANEKGTVSVLRIVKDKDNNHTLSVTRAQVVAHSLRDSIPDMEASVGGLALNGNGTLLATSLMDSFLKPGPQGWRNDVGLFPIHNTDFYANNLSASSPPPPPQVIERVSGASASTLVLSALGNVLVAADDACETEEGYRDKAHIRIFRRSYNGTAHNWDIELDEWGYSLGCTRWAWPGLSLAINHDGSLVAVGAFNNQSNHPAVSVYQYQQQQTKSESNWVLRDVVETGNNRTFVSLSANGNWMAIGTPLWNATNRTGTDRVTLLHYNNNDTDNSNTWETMATIPGTDDNGSLGNGIAMDDNATRLAVGHWGSHLRVYDIVHNDSSICQHNQSVPVFPFPNTSSCEENYSITFNSSSQVYHLALSGNLLAFEDSVGFEGKDTSVVQFWDVSDWNNNNSQDPNKPLLVETGKDNFTETQHQDVILTANGTMAAVLSKGDTDEDPDTIRVFQLLYENENQNHVNATTTANIFRKNGDDDNIVLPWARELPSIQGIKFEAGMGGIVFNGDGRIIVAAMYQVDDKGTASNFTVQAFALNDNDSEWIRMGNNISLETPFGTFSLSRSGHVLAVGDSQVDAAEDTRGREGQVRIFGFSNGDWTLQAEFLGVPNEDGNLGIATSLNADGTVLAAAGILSRDNYGIPAVGAVNVYQKKDDTWTLRDRFSVGNRDEAFGFSLALSGDGKRLAVGSFFERKRSRVRLFEYDDAVRQWGLVFADKGYYLTRLGEDDYDITLHSFGQSVALNEDGTLMATGSASRFRSSNQQNHVRVYNLSACLSWQSNVSMMNDFYDGSNRSKSESDPGKSNANESTASGVPASDSSSSEGSTEDPASSSFALSTTAAVTQLNCCIVLLFHLYF